MMKSLIEAKAVLLKGTDVFSSLPEHEIALIAENSEMRTYAADDAVFFTGDPGNSLYIVESGEVIVKKKDENNRITHIARFLPNDCFGELDLFTGTSRIASSFASTNTRLLIFPKEGTGIKDFIIKNPSVSARILKGIMVDVAMRIRKVNILIKENSPLVQELKKQVYRDKLTGLFNQTYLIEKIRERIKSDNSNFFLLISKPDNFKELNDTYGHDAGDMAIKIMAGEMRDLIGDDSIIVRYKGNAIAVFLSGFSRREAVVFARRIREFMKNLDVSAACKGHRFKITASIGITISPEHGTAVEELLFKTHELPLVGRHRGGSLILFPEDAGEVE